MIVSFSRTRTHSAACALDRRMHPSPRTLRITGRAKTSHRSFHGCTLLRAARLSGFPRTRPHPCVVAAHHILHDHRKKLRRITIDHEREAEWSDAGDFLCALNVLYGYIKSTHPTLYTHECSGAGGPHPNALAGSSIASGKTHKPPLLLPYAGVARVHHQLVHNFCFE